MRRQVFMRHVMSLAIGLTSVGPLSSCAQMHPAERPSPARNFIVFFSADNAALDAGGQQVIQGVIATAQQIGNRKLMIEAEASGDSAHAAFLAQQRTNVVVQALESAGIPQDRLEIAAKPRQLDQVGVVARRVTIQFEP